MIIVKQVFCICGAGTIKNHRLILWAGGYSVRYTSKVVISLKCGDSLQDSTCHQHPEFLL